MFKPGDLVTFNNPNSRWNGTLWRVRCDGTDSREVIVVLKQTFLGYSRGYETCIRKDLLKRHRTNSFGKWFKEHSK